MRLVVVAGTPGAGKTAVLMHTVQALKREARPMVVKVDCLLTEDDQRYNRLDVPVYVGLARDMCPDHFSIYNVDEMLERAREKDVDVLINETAGLCLRCAPYPDGCLAVCVVDVTTGPNAPLKIGPLLTTADIVVITKGDLVSQAEREVFRERVLEVNPECRVIEANGLNGKGAADLAGEIRDAPGVNEDIRLRHNPPLAVCTLCTGETRVAKQHHRGVLRHLDGTIEYVGE